MKTINLLLLKLILIAIALGHTYSLQSQVISGKVKTVKLTTPKKEETIEIKGFPRLQIEQQILTDENNDNILEANETAKLELKIRNLGTSVAKNVKISLNQTDENIKGLLYDSSIEMGDLLPGESRDATLIVAADYKVPRTTARFSIEVLEENGFNIPPEYFDIAIRPETGPFELTWESPNIADTTVFAPNMSIKIKIHSGTPIKTISIFNNNIIYCE